MAIQEVRRWAKDQVAKDDLGKGNPSQSLRAVDEALADLTPAERKKNIEHVRAHATMYYEGRHRVDVPKEVKEKLASLEKRAERLDRLEAARDTLARHGGPPTKQTVAEAVERSVAYRALRAQDLANDVAQEQKQEQKKVSAVRRAVDRGMGF